MFSQGCSGNGREVSREEFAVLHELSYLSDEYCPHCDNHFIVTAAVPKPILKVEGEDARIDSKMLRDDRIQRDEERTIFDVKDAPNRLG